MDDRVTHLRQAAKGRVQDHYLSRQEEDDVMAEGVRLGLTPEQVQAELFSICLQDGAVIERLELQDFRALVQDAVHDRFLDRQKRAALLREGLKRFEHAPQPAEVVGAAIREVLERNRAVDEEDLRADLERRRQSLGAAPQEGALRQQREVVWRSLEAAGVDLAANDLMAVLDEYLPLPVATRKAPEWLVTALVAILVAALMVAGFWIFQAFAAPEKPRHELATPRLPLCDEGCHQELRRIVGRMVDASYARHFSAPVGDSVQFWYQQWQLRCAPFQSLSGEVRAAALSRSPGWQDCEASTVEGVLVRVDGWARRTGPAGPDSACAELARCLEVIPGHARCCQQARAEGCQPEVCAQ